MRVAGMRKRLTSFGAITNMQSIAFKKLIIGKLGTITLKNTANNNRYKK